MTIVALAAGVFSNESTNLSAASYVSNDLFLLSSNHCSIACFTEAIVS